MIEIEEKPFGLMKYQSGILQDHLWLINWVQQIAS